MKGLPTSELKNPEDESQVMYSMAFNLNEFIDQQATDIALNKWLAYLNSHNVKALSIHSNEDD